jgi:hypothetical protein
MVSARQYNTYLIANIKNHDGGGKGICYHLRARGSRLSHVGVHMHNETFEYATWAATSSEEVA